MSFVDWIGTWPGAALLNRSGTAYLFMNGAHIASVRMLVSGILPLDLRLAGLLRGVPPILRLVRHRPSPEPGID